MPLRAKVISKMKNIYTIKWPDNIVEKRRFFLGFLLKAISLYEIDFQSELGNPVQIAQDFYYGRITKEKYEENIEVYWEYIMKLEGNRWRNFQDPDNIKARLALTLLCVTGENLERENLEYAETISWLFQFIDSLGFDSEKASKLMIRYFEFEE